MNKNYNFSFMRITVIILFLKYALSQVIWADIPQIRMGQTSIYDDTYIPVNTSSQVDLTYKSAILMPPMDACVVVSGFQNYLSYEMIFNITIINTTQTYIKINIKTGPQTYLKQLNVNYFVIEQNSSVDAYFQVLTAYYRTLSLSTLNNSNNTGYRVQNFSNITTSFSSTAHIIPAISAIIYYNNDGVLNEVYTDTWKYPNSSTIYQSISVNEKGIITYITITTLVVSSSFFLTPDPYDPMGLLMDVQISTNSSGNTTGWTKFNALSNSDLFQQTDNSLYFGINGFKFSMQQTRLFLLQITNLTDYSQNLKSNNYTLIIKLSVFLLAQRNCSSNTTNKFWINQFTCLPNCNGLLAYPTVNICETCISICNGCQGGNISLCTACRNGTNRKLASGPGSLCVCDYNGGYVDVGVDICVLCSIDLVGCVKCAVKDSCDDCGNTSLYERYNYTLTNPGKFKCRCLSTVVNATTNITNFLVTGLCLPYPGCIKALPYITGPFCDVCDNSTNFQHNITDNSSCVCMTAYKLNTSTYVCQDDCGDGLTPNNIVDACDDNNTDSGDGCSSSCRVQYGYVCTVQVIGGISSCAQKQQIKINFLYAQKTLSANQAILVFSLLPEQHFLAENTFQNSVVSNVQGSRKVKFDAVNSLIFITVDYPVDLESNTYDFNFTFVGLSIFSPDINVQATLNGINAKLVISQKPQQINLIVYVGLGVSAFALALSLMAAFLGQKMMGIQLILPIQAAYFIMVTYPNNILSPISALWSMKFSNGYNSLTGYDTVTNYMLDNRLVIMKYAGQYILNYNIMFLLLVFIIVVIGIVQLRILWLERQQKLFQGIIKKKQDDQRNQDPQKKQNKNKPKKIKKVSQNGENKDLQDEQTEDLTEQENKQEQVILQNVQQQLQDARQNIKNWRNFTYMLIDRFFTILVVTAMMKIVFCFYIQLSNLSYTAQIYDNSLNAGFFFITYATIITGLYYIVYDYKSDKIIVFTCNKGKYAMFYIFTFVGFIVILGALFQSSSSIYIVAIFSIIPIVLIGYQVPYGMSILGFQNIVAVICQLPFLISVVVSIMLNMNGDTLDQPMAYIFCYAIIGSTGLSELLTIIRMIKMIDCKKVSCFQFTDRKKDNSNDKNRKKNKVAKLQLDMQKDYDEFSEDSVRAVLFQRKKKDKQEEALPDQIKNKEGAQTASKKSQLKKQQKQKSNQQQDEEDDQEIDQLQKIKLKLRKQLKQKKQSGKVK